MTTDTLAHIKASSAGDSPAELLQRVRDLKAHVRGLEPHLSGPGIGNRFGHFGGAADPQSANQQAARVERHKVEIEYLIDRLESLDEPVLAAQARAA